MRREWTRTTGKTQVSLEEARKMLGEEVYEAGKEYIVLQNGKYAPRNLTFLIPRVWEQVAMCVSAGTSLLSPLDGYDLRENPEVAKSIDATLKKLEASYTEVLPGQFWRSKKGGACFRPTDEAKATHWLIRAQWDGRKGEAEERRRLAATIDEARYYFSTSSHGGGFGVDWVIIDKPAAI